MFRIAYVNGRYVRTDEAAVHIEDRGYQFADGVYEVVAVANSALVDEMPHMARLARSLKEMDIAWPVSERALRHIVREVVRRNHLVDGMIYLQITRGVAPRDHAFPANARPALVVTAKRLAPQRPELAENGIGVISIPDLRWDRCDIKSVSLLPNVLGKQQAKKAGAFEAWQIADDGTVTEGTSTNAWIVDRDGAIVTHPADCAILDGITRQTVLRVAREAGMKVVERTFSLDEALTAREAFLTSTTAAVLPVVTIDGRPIGNGAPGSTTLDLRERYLAEIERQTRTES
ncbi:MAG TPA: D-amino-acid transaminase [Alphaproteobacteria bacterium]|jgi:D-alanine transaminase|nr:D-amino-acid transaminase [Alphaproteobacteria bacterium]